jgi:hypothetical protein
MISDAIKIAAGLTTIAATVGGLIYYVSKKTAENDLLLIKQKVGANIDFIDAYVALMGSDALSVKQMGELEQLRQDYKVNFATCTYNEMVILLAQSNGIYMTVRDAAKAHQKK